MRSRRVTRPDRDVARLLLDELWEAVLSDDRSAVAPVLRQLINSNEASIRFCLPTQLLGKLADNDLDALCLQRGDGEAGRWDPRGFAASVIVPWNRANQFVLGRGGDPYVSNPLRRPRIDYGLEQMAHREEWDLLHEVLRDVQDKSDVYYS